jgi:Protein of unknown function (DUF4013)
MTIDFGRAVTYPFEDGDWRRKLLLLLILSFVPGLNVLVWGGYGLSVARNIARRERTPLVTWHEWSDIVVRGLLSLVATGLYGLPALVIGGCFLSLSLVLGERVESASFLAMRCLGYLIAVGYGLAVSVLVTTGHVAFARTDQFSSYLDVRERLADVGRYRSRLVTLTVIQIVSGLLVLVALIIGGVLMLVGVNVAVRIGGLGTLLAVPALLLVIIGVVALLTLAALANGYFIGMTALIIGREAKAQTT